MPADEQDALAALERLLRHDVISLEEARLAARLITGRDDVEFPPPVPPAPPGADGTGEAPPAPPG
jgi:hypothetical protein